MNAKDRVKNLMENGRKKKKTESKIRATARGGPYNLGDVAFKSARENGGTNANNNPSRLLKKDDKPGNKNANDRLYEKAKKEAASAKKKKASDAVTREANAKLATARLYAKKKNMEK